MKRRRFFSQTAIALVLLLTICQCGGPKVENLVIDPEFKDRPLENCTFLIGGVTSIVSEDKSHDISTAAGAGYLRDRLGEDLPGVNTIPATMVIDMMGQEDYWRFLENYKSTLNVSDEDLLKLHGPLTANPGPAYLVMVRIENYERWQTKSEARDSTGALTNKYRRAHRKIVAKFNLWDIKSQKPVWSGQLGYVATATNDYPQSDVNWSDELGLLGSLIDIVEEGAAIDEEKTYVYPEMPDFWWASNRLFHNFAEALRKSARR
ncbi:MAG: hypothetical protein JSU87_11985 [Gemmatimonadota bacterium]|nr:MAG: hypothetical protein JSU87_11985 [Gemmatimonadota bacterium]